MQLLHSSPLAAPEFASLSLLLSAGGTTKPLMVVSTLSTLSRGSALEALEELHGHVGRIILAASSSSSSKDDAAVRTTGLFAAELMREDEKSLRSTMQIYRPATAHGVGLHYRVMRGPEASKLQALVVASSAAKSAEHPSSEVLGVILCVGVAGLALAHGGSESTVYALQQRMSDCIGYILQRNADAAQAQALLTTFLLSINDEDRISNERMEAPNLLVLPEVSDNDKSKSVLSSPMGMMSPIADFRKGSKRAGKQGNMDGGDDGPEEPEEMGFPLSLDLGSAEAARVLADRLSVLSVAESDTLLRKYEHSGQERKANLDLTSVAKSRFRRRKTDARDADFDNFDYKGPAKQTEKRTTAAKAIPALPQPTQEQPAAGKLQLKSSKKDTRKAPSGSRRLGAHVGENHNRRRSSVRHQFEDDMSQDTRSHSGNHDGASSVMSQQARIQVQIALNEDLNCSYKLSQLSSCNVEGVVQVSVKSHGGRSSNIPFALLIRDPSSHIDTLSENKKLADNVTNSQNGKEEPADYKFNILIPKLEAYFPVMKYKCTGDLRPVPIRVQAKVKVDGGFCRVALQISSNPNNDASLSDLTIVMGVPDKVRGETLATQPPGGVWDESKSSVIWCVSELGSGEKFQLQARFELAEAAAPSADDLSFPVLVRCQCMYVQLSDIEFEVRERPEAFPAEIHMKVARRFRLSHREKNG